LEEPISRRLMQLAKIYLGAFSKRVEDLDITRYHYILLLIAEYEGQLTQKKLAEITGKDKSSMVNIIDTLTAKGYVYREINPGDRREQLIRITEKAQRDIPSISRSFSLLNNKATEGISPEKLDIFNDVLQQMATNLKPLASYTVSFTKQVKKTNT
jgi:MarR family transcriptional regulator for hemolysin